MTDTKAAFELRPVDRDRLYLSIVDQIIVGIRSGSFPAGSALPAERRLAELLGTSRHSVREAIRVLEHAGVVVVRTGSGTYVTETGASKAAAVRARTALTGDPSPLDVLTARSAVEPACAAEAARIAHPDDVDLIIQAIELQTSLAHDSDAALEADYAFHITVARATHNPILLDLVQQLTALMRQAARQDFQRRVHEQAEVREKYLQHHKAILQAIATHSPDEAAAAMLMHLTTVNTDLDREAD
jgi:GntR family transcriptional regulator, transcriptional repressor for pyruvate dehydrogenase complex